jgi:hypothetical protein
MKPLRLLPLLIAALLPLWLVFYVWRIPTVDHGEPSPERMKQRIAAIAREPHSVAHPEARERVAATLVDELRQLGGTPELYVYPEQRAKGYTFDVTNIFCEFAPRIACPDTTWLMLVAHYDSRYPWAPVRDTVSSFGAADDGYGVAVALGCLEQALGHRHSWRQGVRILLTDAEEVGMVGMQLAREHDRALFDRVGLLINIEARGPFGPCLLFESSEGNARLINLYGRTAVAPTAFSITNAVYRLMPNYTDFRVVRDSIPGLNFAAVADINHYHSERDCLEAVSLATLGHYGRQIYPLVDAYLTSPRYADPDALRSHRDSFFFTLPLLGLFHCSSPLFIFINIVVYALALALFMTARRDPRSLAAVGGRMLGEGCLVFVAGTLVSLIAARAAGARWSLLGIIYGVEADNVILIATLALLAVGLLVWVCRTTDLVSRLYGAIFCFAVLGVVMLFVAGDNLPFLLPMAIACLTTLLDRFGHRHQFIPIGIFLILLHAYQFIGFLAMSLTIGALGVTLFIAFFDLLLAATFGKIYYSEQHR